MKNYNSFKLMNNRIKYIFNVIQKNGPISKSELISKTKIKLTTLNRDLQVLIDKKIIVETDIGESTGGRKPSLYDLNPNDFYIIGIDISRIYTRIVLTNLKLKVIEEKLLIQEYSIENANEIIPTSIEDICRNLGVKRLSIIGIGIGIVGGFDVKPLYNTLCKLFNVPICIDNGANAAVIGEYHFGIGKGKENIAYINCGVGIRAGIISSGVLIRTINNVEDAFGHMIVEANGELCSCGNYGCIESYVSVSNIAKKFSNNVKENINYKDVCSFAEKNNEYAKKIIKEAALYLGIGLSNYMKLFNPELIILSGPLVNHSELFYETAKEIALKKCHIRDNNIQFSKNGYYEEQSIAVGACAMVIEQLVNEEKGEVHI